MLAIEKQNKYYNYKKISTPFLVMDKDIIQNKYREIKNAYEGIDIYYAVKTNSHIRIINFLNELGSGFEIASVQELKDVISVGVKSEKIISSNPLKKPDFIQECHQAGVEYFAFDSQMEIDKLSDFAPGSKGYIRITVDNSKSEWPLSKKFGVKAKEALKLLIYASQSKIKPYGITFHVGSQCMDALSWQQALEQVYRIFQQAKQHNINLKMINIGGGIPIQYQKDIPSINQIGKVVTSTIKEKFNGVKVELMMEPGRAIVGDSGNIVTKVILRSKREGENWLYLDIGVFNGLMETLEGIKYEILSERHLANPDIHFDLIPYTVAGPSCDSVDTIFKNYLLPADLKLGDILYLVNTGAYTTSYASNFNGFDIPKTYFIEK